jgi:hypothetical protein
VKDAAWEKHKKANALPGAGVFHTAEQLTPRLPNCAELSLRARCFTVIPGWFRRSNAGPSHIPDSGPSGASTSPESGSAVLFRVRVLSRENRKIWIIFSLHAYILW